MAMRVNVMKDCNSLLNFTTWKEAIQNANHVETKPKVVLNFIINMDGHQ